MSTDLITSEIDSHPGKYDAASDVAGMKIVFVNIFMIGTPERWVLVDAGLPGFAEKIRTFAEARFGAGTKPQAIILTHGHFDHVGALHSILKFWDVPVYAHTLEMPYLTGLSSYPPPDPAIGGGAMSYMSWTFPIRPLHLKDRIKELREGTFIPDTPEWRVIHTPGHSPGHISLFRERDAVLIAGDAFVTVNQNAAGAVIRQTQEVHGPPAYFTCDWEAAKLSVEKLQALEPFVAATGHGIPMRGPELKYALRHLNNNFESLSIPSCGRYVRKAALTDAQGIVEMPVPVSFYVPRIVAAACLTTLAGIVIYKLVKKK
jgi:glyoxylase-like metal-dependent hydrolase (beta-lactamase superfamily II)